MIMFDPSEYIKGLQQLLISDKKKIGFLCGAGTSLAKKNKNSLNVPAIGAMTESVIQDLCKKEKYQKAVLEIKQEIIERYGEAGFHIESLLSNVEEKKEIIGKGILNGLNENDFAALSQEIQRLIHDIVSVHLKIDKDAYNNMVHCDFAQWIAQAERKNAVEIFTTNYDYLFEIGLEHNNVPYYDGFSGTYNPFFYSHSVDDFNYLPQQTKLWKIHGSLGWSVGEDGKIIRNALCENSGEHNNDILIYPSISKYEHSKKMPYTALMDRLSNFLRQEDTVLFVCGYSFGDDHINERILAGLRNGITSHVYVLFYDKAWKGNIPYYTLNECSKMAQIALSNPRISVFGCRNAVIGGKYGEWKLKREPDKNDDINISLYFDEDAPENVSMSLKEEQKGNEEWTGRGNLKITDFAKLVVFLQSMIVNN